MSLVSFTHSLREAVYPQQHRRAKVAGMPISVKDLDVGELGKVKLFVSFPCPNLGEEPQIFRVFSVRGSVKHNPTVSPTFQGIRVFQCEKLAVAPSFWGTCATHPKWSRFYDGVTDFLTLAKWLVMWLSGNKRILVPALVLTSLETGLNPSAKLEMDEMRFNFWINNLVHFTFNVFVYWDFSIFVYPPGN